MANVYTELTQFQLKMEYGFLLFSHRHRLHRNIVVNWMSESRLMQPWQMGSRASWTKWAKKWLNADNSNNPFLCAVFFSLSRPKQEKKTKWICCVQIILTDFVVAFYRPQRMRTFACLCAGRHCWSYTIRNYEIMVHGLFTLIVAVLVLHPLDVDDDDGVVGGSNIILRPSAFYWNANCVLQCDASI